MHYLYLVEIQGKLPYYEIGSTYNLRYDLRILERTLRLPVVLRLYANINGPEIMSFFHSHPIFQAWRIPLRVHGISRSSAYRMHPDFMFLLGEFLKVYSRGKISLDPRFDWTQEAMEVELSTS